MQTDACVCAGTHLATVLSGNNKPLDEAKRGRHNTLLPRSSPPASLLMALTAGRSPWPTASNENKWRGGRDNHSYGNSMESVTGTFRGVRLPGAADSPLTTSSSMISFIYCALHFLLKTTVSHSLFLCEKAMKSCLLALRLTSKCLYNNNEQSLFYFNNAQSFSGRINQKWITHCSILPNAKMKTSLHSKQRRYHCIFCCHLIFLFHFGDTFNGVWRPKAKWIFASL